MNNSKDCGCACTSAPKLIHCAQKTLEEAGFTEFEHLRLADLGLLKGKSPVSDELIAHVAEKGKTLLNG